MNLIDRIHSKGHAQHTHHRNEEHGHQAPFWVRHYDIVVNLVTLGRTQAVHRQTLSLVNPQPGAAVLDIGCGTGKLALAVEEIVGATGTVVGLDVEQAMIEQAQAHARSNGSQATFEVASITHIPYADETFDVVFNTLVYHHLTEGARAEAFGEVMRVLKPGGQFVLVDINPTRRNILTSLPGHNRLAATDYVRNEVTAHMCSAGFAVIDDGPHPSKQLSYAIGKKAQA